MGSEREDFRADLGKSFFGRKKIVGQRRQVGRFCGRVEKTTKSIGLSYMARRPTVKTGPENPYSYKVVWSDPTKPQVQRLHPYYPMLDGQGVSPNFELEHHGVHLLMGEINEESCAGAIDWILRENFAPTRKKHLTMILCSPGGDLTSCFALIDVMAGSVIPVHTLGIGQIASCGLLLFISGAKGFRTLTPNTSILSHQYSWGAYGKEHELFAQAREYELTTKRMMTHYKRCTGLSEANIRKYLLPPQDIWLSAHEAKTLNVCDRVHNFECVRPEPAKSMKRVG